MCRILLVFIALNALTCTNGYAKEIKGFNFRESYALAEVVANDDIAKVFENSLFVIPVLKNDFGLLSGVQSLTIAQNPTFGSAEVQSDHTIKYSPSRGFIGTDQLKYTVCAKDGGCSTGTVYIEVMDYDYKPSAINDTVVIVLGKNSSGLRINVLENDEFVFDEPLSLSIVVDAKQGTVTVNSDKTMSVAFPRDFFGLDSLEYEVCDKELDCAIAKVIFDVRPSGISGTSNFPNAFSPNNDGFNDTFFLPDLVGFSNLSIQVVSQWGQLVYENRAYQNDWDGIANKGPGSGKKLPSGTYYYVIAVGGTDTKATGFVFISR